MKKYIIISIILILVLIGIIIYKHVMYTHITVQFKELRPMEENIPVYYKGIVIGKAKERKHTDDYQHTLIKVVLYPKNLHLPVNTEVELRQILKNKKTSDYLELIYPETPSEKLISDGSYLKGYTTVDMEAYAKNVRPEDLEGIKENLSGAAENLNTALCGLSELFVLLQDVVRENQVNLKGSTANIKNATSNINQATLKINNSIREEQLNSAMTNIENSIGNIEKITKDINNTSTGINQSMPRITSSIKDAQNTLANVNAISCGVRQTLRKHFGGLRLMFGKTIQENECKPCK